MIKSRIGVLCAEESRYNVKKLLIDARQDDEACRSAEQ